MVSCCAGSCVLLPFLRFFRPGGVQSYLVSSSRKTDFRLQQPGLRGVLDSFCTLAPERRHGAKNAKWWRFLTRRAYRRPATQTIQERRTNAEVGGADFPLLFVPPFSVCRSTPHTVHSRHAPREGRPGRQADTAVLGPPSQHKQAHAPAASKKLVQRRN